jgi:hypothetical protein
MDDAQVNGAMHAVVKAILAIVNDKLGGQYESADMVVRARFSETFGDVQWEASLGRLEGLGASPLDALTALEIIATGAAMEADRRRSRR